MQPQVIRIWLDVYGENALKIVPIESPQGGFIMQGVRGRSTLIIWKLGVVLRP